MVTIANDVLPVGTPVDDAEWASGGVVVKPTEDSIWESDGWDYITTTAPLDSMMGMLVEEDKWVCVEYSNGMTWWRPVVVLIDLRDPR